MPRWTSGSWMPGGASGAAAVTLLLLGGTLILLAPSASAGAYQVPVINVTFEYDRYTAEFKDAGPAILYANGTVSVKKDPSSKGVAALEAVIDTGWRLLVSPSVLVASENPTSFRVTVVIPPGTPSNLSATLNVFCTYPRAMPASDTAVITVGPRHGVRAVLEKPVQLAGPGQAPRFTAVVTNTGNAMDTVRCGPGIGPWSQYTARRSYTANSSLLLEMAPGESRKISFTGHFNKGGVGQPDMITFSFPVYSMDPGNRSQVLQDIIILTLYAEPDLWGWVDVPTVATVLWAISMFAIIVSVVRRKGRMRFRVPLVKEVGKNGRA